MARRSFRIGCFVLILGAILGCSRHDAGSDSSLEIVRLEGREADLVDDYAELDRRAHIGVIEDAKVAALSGDGDRAFAIGDAYATFNMFTEARFWFQVAAENGNGAGMQRYSSLIRKSDCMRSIFWLKRALASGDIRGEAVADNEADLARLQASCTYGKGAAAVK